MRNRIVALLLCVLILPACFLSCASDEIGEDNPNTADKNVLPEASAVILERAPSETPLYDNSSDITLHKRGDVNADGVRDIKDYALIRRVVNRTYDFCDKNEIFADVNYDGEVTKLDWILLRQSFDGTYNIKLEMVQPPESEKEEFVEAYLDRYNRRDWLTKEEVETNFCGPYGDGKYYTVYVTYNEMIVGCMEYEFDFNGRILWFPDTNAALVWDGEKIYTLQEGYDNGFFDDLDLEDLETRYSGYKQQNR